MNNPDRRKKKFINILVCLIPLVVVSYLSVMTVSESFCIRSVSVWDWCVLLLILLLINVAIGYRNNVCRWKSSLLISCCLAFVHLLDQTNCWLDKRTWLDRGMPGNHFATCGLLSLEKHIPKSVIDDKGFMEICRQFRCREALSVNDRIELAVKLADAFSKQISSGENYLSYKNVVKLLGQPDNFGISQVSIAYRLYSEDGNLSELDFVGVHPPFYDKVLVTTGYH